MSEQKLDLLVIGSGVTAACTAWDASTRGMTTGLIAEEDFAVEYDGRPPELLHGSLRYMKQEDFRTVRDSSAEMKFLQHAAPHLLDPVPVLVPVYTKGFRNYWANTAGLNMYDRLARVKSSERRRMIRRDEALDMEPLLKKKGLICAEFYNDYMISEARLAVELLKSARDHGAMIINYAEVNQWLSWGGKLSGVTVTDRLSGKSYAISASHIIDARESHPEEGRGGDGSEWNQAAYACRSVHMVLDSRQLPVHQACYYKMPDQDMLSVIPRSGKVIVSTQVTSDVSNSSEYPGLSEAELQMLINKVHHAFKDIQLQSSEVESCWAAVRNVRSSPVDEGSGKGRDILTSEDNSRIIVSCDRAAGFRKHAEAAVNLVAERLQEENRTIYPPCTTDRRSLSGSIPEGSLHADYYAFKKAVIKQGRRLGIHIDVSLELLGRYGSGTEELFRNMEREGSVKSAEQRLLEAELHYAVHHEMTTSAADFLLRRSLWMRYNRHKAEQLMNSILQRMRELLDWDQDELHRQRELLQNSMQMLWMEKKVLSKP
nr:glycerol-3-phosphate dehydrogenase/oxidase [Paenibacillus lemnae]